MPTRVSLALQRAEKTALDQQPRVQCEQSHQQWEVPHTAAGEQMNPTTRPSFPLLHECQLKCKCRCLLREQGEGSMFGLVTTQAASSATQGQTDLLLEVRVLDDLIQSRIGSGI